MNTTPPPHHVEHEAAVLGCVLDTQNPDALFDELSLELFYDERHRTIYAAIQEFRREFEISMVNLSEWAHRKKLVERCGGLNYLLALPQNVVSLHNWSSYLDSVKDYAIRRSALYDAQTIAEIASDPTKTARDIRAASERMAESYSRDGNSRNGLTIRTPNELINMAFDGNDIILGDRLLAKGQPLTILAPGGTGKSRLLLQLIASIISESDFLGLPTKGKDLSFLIIQTENSNRRLQQDLHRVKAHLNGTWDKFDKQVRIHTLETDHDGMVFLSDPKNVSAILKLISNHNPDVIVFDPLGDFCMGDPNKDQDMRDTCRCISNLCRQGKPNRAIIVIHHAGTGKFGAAKTTGYDRSSFGRNSKVLHSWTRGQINISPGAKDDNNSIVIACGKCSNGKEFEPFAAKLNPETMIYELDPSFDFEAWQSDIGNKPAPKAVSLDAIRDTCPVPGISKPDLARRIISEFGCARPTAYRWIEKAQKAKLLHRSKVDENYFRS